MLPQPDGAASLDADTAPGSGTASSSAHLEEEAATAAAIYGLIVGSAVMASVHGQTVTQLAVAVLVTLVIYWTAERFASFMAQWIVHPPSSIRSHLFRELGRGWELVTASFMPLGVLVVSRLLGATVYGAVLAALVCATVLLAAAGWEVGREAGLRPRYRLVTGLCAGALGLALIALKTLLH